MLKVANCPKCGKVFQKNVRNLCQDCMKTVDHGYDLCDGFLRSHPKATTDELHQVTGVTQTEIISFIKNNRLPVSIYPNLTYPCNSCSAPIRQQHLCSSCRIRIISDIHQLKEQEAKLQERSGFQIRERFSRT
ncbi:MULTISPECIES: flagellar protein [unclassified Paenibacillus]|uniref:flagellar protein n=1 Tax=unclassified Paenibacillus TaxID=185978 RepID=UPI001FD734A6|nr:MULTISPECIES: flagellar protein [unclassified Paenibacillus]